MSAHLSLVTVLCDLTLKFNAYYTYSFKLLKFNHKTNPRLKALDLRFNQSYIQAAYSLNHHTLALITQGRSSGPNNVIATRL